MGWGPCWAFRFLPVTYPLRQETRFMHMILSVGKRGKTTLASLSMLKVPPPFFLGLCKSKQGVFWFLDLDGDVSTKFKQLPHLTTFHSDTYTTYTVEHPIILFVHHVLKNPWISMGPLFGREELRRQVRPISYPKRRWERSVGVPLGSAEQVQCGKPWKIHFLTLKIGS